MHIRTDIIRQYNNHSLPVQHNKSDLYYCQSSQYAVNLSSSIYDFRKSQFTCNEKYYHPISRLIDTMIGKEKRFIVCTPE